MLIGFLNGSYRERISPSLDHRRVYVNERGERQKPETGKDTTMAAQRRSHNPPPPPKKKSGQLQHFLNKKRKHISSSLLHCSACFSCYSTPRLLSFVSVRLFRSHVNRFWHAMTLTVVHKSPFPWTVSACLFWDETTAIRSSAPEIPAVSAPRLCQTHTHALTQTHNHNNLMLLHRHFKPSGLFSGKVQIKLY